MNVFEVVKKVRVFDETIGKIKQRTITQEITFPATVDEITMKMWSDYFIAKESDPDWVKEMEKLPAPAQLEKMGEWDNKQWCDYYILVIKYLQCFTSSDLALLADAPLMEGNGIMAIYFQIIAMINTYEPTVRETFEYKGERYVVDRIEVDRFGRTHYGKNLTANQVIDALQYEHIFSVKSPDGKFMIEDRRYQIDIALLALLTKKVNPDGTLDERPLDYMERQAWTEDKIMRFMDVPMPIALDIDFFLRSLKMNSLITLMRVPSSKRGK